MRRDLSLIHIWHESRRIDNQLRGRAGRQGDPGASRFYLSLEDDLMRLFGGDRVSSLMNTLKIDEDTPIENRMITNTLESAQKKLEGRNFEIRKNVLKYDDVMNQQHEIIYGQRRKVLDGEDISTEMHKMCIRDRGRALPYGYSSPPLLPVGWYWAQVHFLNFRPLPQGQGSLRPILTTRTG